MKVLLSKLFSRIVKQSKSLDVYLNDDDNAYPERMDRLINNSVTARSAASIMIQYLIGKGYGEQADNLIVNKPKNLRLIDFADDVADDIVKHRGVFIHVNWNAVYQIVDMSVIPYEWCRLGKSDSNDYSGKVAICKDWQKAKKSDIELIDVYNPKQKVIDVQVEKAGGWDKYKGQVLFVNMDSKLIYPLSRIDAVANDCDSESQAGVYKNHLLRKGFFGNTLVVTRPLVDNHLDTDSDEYRRQESERDAFKKAVESMIGAENVGGVLCLEMDFAGEKLEDAILIKNIESKIDDRLFDYTENSVRENILVAFNNIPAGLLKTSDNSMFGNSGEAILEMKRTFWENTSKERNLLTGVINALLEKSVDYSTVKVKPINLIQQDIIVEGAENPSKEKLLAQAQLRGSVGGVQAILQIQASVQQGITDYNAAVAMLEQIFGFTNEEAKAVLGTPVIKNTPS